ncbi:GTPase Der [Bacteroidota bacterium]|nr:GTPase Der [Bacteroidota bacterium]
MNNTVAIVGRPNVGKSTLYNRLVGERMAIVDDFSGVTRDRLYGIGEWNGKTFNIIDTGGFVTHSEDIFESEIRKQVEIAIDEATVIIFLVDVTCGITDLEIDIADMLRRTNKKVLVAVNKVDNNARLLDANEFYSLGFEDVFFIASISGSGTGELLDEVVLNIDDTAEVLRTDIPRFAIVGQPNVGKSSMVNAMLGQDRNIVTDIAGTTRDSIHTYYNLFHKEFYLVDTAGIRKKAKVHEFLEFYSVIRAIKAMDEADIIVLMIDATTGIEQQDLNIFSMAVKKKKGIVLVVNKWDLIEKNTKTTKVMEESIHHRIAPFKDVPIVFTSVIEKQRIFKVIEEAIKVHENRKRKISTSVLNEVMSKAISETPPPSYRGNYVQIKYITQLPTYFPAFAFFCNHPAEIKEPYRNFLENQLRKNFDFHGTPIQIYFRKK